jgi:hypothetical protein
MRENVVAYFHFKWTKNRGAGQRDSHFRWTNFWGAAQNQAFR